MSHSNKEIDSLFSNWDKDDSPGCMLAVIKDGDMIYERGYGMANLEHSVEIDSNTVFRIGSVSKQFTAMCIAILAKKKLLSLDDGIREHVPELLPYATPINIHHLIHHTSGLRDYTSLIAIAMATQESRIFDNIVKDDLIEVLSKQRKLNFRPGERFDYSNSNYFLLGLIVERVSAKHSGNLLTSTSSNH